jgi:hypothetical protein
VTVTPQVDLEQVNYDIGQLDAGREHDDGGALQAQKDELKAQIRTSNEKMKRINVRSPSRRFA